MFTLEQVVINQTPTARFRHSKRPLFWVALIACPGGSVPEVGNLLQATNKNRKSMTNNSKEDTRFRVLRLLEESPDLTQRQIAEALGISLGGVNYCLRALASKGLVKIKNFRNSNNKTGYAYLLTPKGITAKTTLTAHFLKRKMEEYEALKEEIESLEKEVKKIPK